MKMNLVKHGNNAIHWFERQERRGDFEGDIVSVRNHPFQKTEKSSAGIEIDGDYAISWNEGDLTWCAGNLLLARLKPYVTVPATSTRTQNFSINPMKVNHYTVLAVVSILLTIAGLSWLSYTIVDQQKQIEQLQEQLQHEQMKYKIIINDPLVREAMEAGG